ncbi:MAG: universal stress protein [Actinomycetota bacterium]|nr:universal stress protein [Actinomycetota bacterium]
MTAVPEPSPSSGVPAERPRPWVVVGVDTSASARLAVVWASGYVSAMSGTLVACSAVPSEQPTFDDRPERLAALEERARAESDAAEARARQVLTEEIGEPAAASTVLMIRAGGVADVLVEAARDADLLVIGTTPRGRLGRALLGAFRPGVVGATRCPVVLVPAGDPPG